MIPPWSSGHNDPVSGINLNLTRNYYVRTFLYSSDTCLRRHFANVVPKIFGVRNQRKSIFEEYPSKKPTASAISCWKNNLHEKSLGTAALRPPRVEKTPIRLLIIPNGPFLSSPLAQYLWASLGRPPTSVFFDICVRGKGESHRLIVREPSPLLVPYPTFQRDHFESAVSTGDCLSFIACSTLFYGRTEVGLVNR